MFCALDAQPAIGSAMAAALIILCITKPPLQPCSSDRLRRPMAERHKVERLDHAEAPGEGVFGSFSPLTSDDPAARREIPSVL